jgi:hypothetical protein
MRRAAAVLVLASVGTAGGGPGDDDTDLARGREAAREALRTSCGRCHDHARPTAIPAALRIFDLQQQEWSVRITDLHLDHIEGRLEGFHVPQPDQVTIRTFVDAERARRAAVATRPADDGPVP